MDNRFASSSSSSGVPTELCLSMTLRYLAGGTVYDIIDMHSVAVATFYSVLWKCIDAINDAYPMSFPCNDSHKLHSISRGFHDLNKRTLPGCVGAIDGLAIEVRKPLAWDTLFPVQFMNRKVFGA